MGIPVGSQYEVQVRARAVKTVVCGKCRDSYVYVVERAGTGTGFSPLWLDNRGATARARDEASSRAEKALVKAVDPVRCPSCGWYQDDMVREARRRRGKWFLVFALVAGSLGALIALIAWLVEDRFYEPSSREVWHWAAALFGSAAFALALRHANCANWSPNSDTMWKRRNEPKEAGLAMSKVEYDRMAAGSAGPERVAPRDPETPPPA